MTSDMDFIEAIGSCKLNPNLYSLNQIMCDVPMLSHEDPVLYAIYLHYNAHVLTQDDKNKICITIDTLRHNRSVIEHTNNTYMDRHKNN